MLEGVQHEDECGNDGYEPSSLVIVLDANLEQVDGTAEDKGEKDEHERAILVVSECGRSACDIAGEI